MSHHIQFANYSPAADIVVSAVCLVMAILVAFSYLSRERKSRLFLLMVALVFAAAWADMTFYVLATVPATQVLANWLRCGYHSLLYLLFVYYVAYVCEVTHYEHQRRYLLFANATLLALVACEVLATMQGPSFAVRGDTMVFEERGIFFLGFIAFGAIFTMLLARVRHHLYHRIMRGFFGTLAVSLSLLLIQGLGGQSSFTTAAFLLPLVAIMYTMHANPYNAALGTNDVSTMQDYLHYCHAGRKDFVLMSLYMREFAGEGREMPEDLQRLIRQFTYDLAKKSRYFMAGRGHMVLVLQKSQYPDYEGRVRRMLDEFDVMYERYRYDYKIVVCEATDEIGEHNEYLSLIRSVHRNMAECSVRRVTHADIDQFRRSEYILRELADIGREQDLDDPRVLVFCQPVLDVRTGRYDTAEALMRLDLDELGIVYPDQFIGLAEEHGLIHTLTEIVLHKTCEAMRGFCEDGYQIRRISVNVSAIELKCDAFCDDVMGIIAASGIPGDKIAIELTESQNEGDFMLMKSKIGELRKQGIRFYLDDFGTGYSNMERIMELPFDIIKFDRSLVVASTGRTRSRDMVANLASMFYNMSYAVLYEGIERDADESMCKGMYATYLQGFKYARPTPIADLPRYLSRAEASEDHVAKRLVASA